MSIMMAHADDIAQMASGQRAAAQDLETARDARAKSTRLPVDTEDGDIATPKEDAPTEDDIPLN